MAHELKIWAVIVGIDTYSTDPKANLSGCVRDVEDVFGFLTSNLHVREDQITMLLAPDPATNLPGRSYSEPKRDMILGALADVKRKGRPGDFVWFHFSGHGDRVKTKFPSLKTDTTYDEVLCALDDDLRDVDLDASLSSLKDAGLKVLAVLDTCHSGGATRDHDSFQVRCRSWRHQSALQEQASSETDRVSQSALRNATVKETWFYRNRDYHVVAACQPYQLAWECKDDQGLPRGRLTYLFMKILRSDTHFGKLKYKLLQQYLDNEGWVKFNQQPMILGDGNAVLGAHALPDRNPADITVVDIQSEVLILNRGAATGVRIGDQYELFPPPVPLVELGASKIEVTVTSVTEMTAEVDKKDISGQFSIIGVGWSGRLKSRAQVPKIQVLPFPSPYEAYLAKLAKPSDLRLFLFDFVTEGDDQNGNLTFVVRVSNPGDVEILDNGGLPMIPIPKISVCDDNLLEKLTGLLQHLYAYRTLEELKPLNKNKVPKYEFRVIDMPIESNAPNAEVLATKQVIFRNLEPKPVFVTILNLTAAWGVYRIFPFEDDASLAVEPGNEIPELIIDMELSKIFNASNSASRPAEMRDILKIFITSKQASFDHYQLEDLEPEGPPAREIFRKAKARIPQGFDWFCDEIFISTPLERP